MHEAMGFLYITIKDHSAVKQTDLNKPCIPIGTLILLRVVNEG